MGGLDDFSQIHAVFSLVHSVFSQWLRHHGAANAKPAEEPFQISAGGLLEQDIKEKVYCEIKAAANRIDKKDDNHLLPENWGAQVTLSLTVDETSALNPGVALNTPMHAGITNFKGEYLTGPTTPLATATYPFLSSPQSYSLGLGGILSSQGTRIDKFGSYWDLDKLKSDPKPGDTCFVDGQPKPPAQGSSFLLESNLGIYEWLHDALLTETLYPSSQTTPVSSPANNQDYVSYEVKFASRRETFDLRASRSAKEKMTYQ
jgi:hypothetical protein